MNGEALIHIVRPLVRGGSETNRLQSALGTTFRRVDENPYWTFYKFDLPAGEFAGGEFRQDATGGKALLSLSPRDAAGMTEDSLDLAEWGQVARLDVYPDAGPEGAYAHVYDVDGVQVTFQFEGESERLQTLALEWGAEGGNTPPA